MTRGLQVSPRWVGSHLLVLPARSDPPQPLPHCVLPRCWPPSGSDTLQLLAHIRAFAHAVPTSQNAPLPLRPHCSHVATRQMPTPLCLLQVPRPLGSLSQHWFHNTVYRHVCLPTVRWVLQSEGHKVFISILPFYWNAGKWACNTCLPNT